MTGKRRSGKYLRTILDFFRIEGGIEAKEITTPDNPESGYRRLYPKSDGWYMLDSTGDEIKVNSGGSGSSSGSYMPSGW
jgi:hypothetical protein